LKHVATDSLLFGSYVGYFMTLYQWQKLCSITEEVKLIITVSAHHCIQSRTAQSSLSQDPVSPSLYKYKLIVSKKCPWKTLWYSGLLSEVPQFESRLF